MSLFDVSTIGAKKDKKILSPEGFRKSQPSTHLIGRSMAQMQSAIGDLDHNLVIQFCTGGRWSMHQLLNYMLLKTGPAKIWMTTWTITEQPMRALLQMINDGLITELNAILDYRIERRKPEAFQLATNLITRIKLTKCHAKVLVVQNDSWNIAVITTANFSNNPRIEAGAIFTDRDSAEFHKKWIDDVIDGKEVFRAR